MGYFNSDRWNRELADDLYNLAKHIVATEGEIEIRRFMGQGFDPEQLDHFLRRGAEITAQNINDSTEALINERQTAKAKFTDIVEAFIMLLLGGERAQSRAQHLAQGRAQSLQSISQLEAAKQRGGIYTKRWVWSHSPNSRHEHLAGETRLLTEPFSNGLQHPGDPSAPPDQTANCKCSMTVEGGPTAGMLMGGKSENWRGEPRDPETGKWTASIAKLESRKQYWETELSNAHEAKKPNPARIQRAETELSKVNEKLDTVPVSTFPGRGVGRGVDPGGTISMDELLGGA